jgi:hypothetical protein
MDGFAAGRTAAKLPPLTWRCFTLRPLPMKAPTCPRLIAPGYGAWITVVVGGVTYVVVGAGAT